MTHRFARPRALARGAALPVALPATDSFVKARGPDDLPAARMATLNDNPNRCQSIQWLAWLCPAWYP